MINLNDAKCFGCQACVDACPKKCISFTKNINGYLYPDVDMDLCVKCGKCNSVCLMESMPDSGKTAHSALFWHYEKSVLDGSSSGGISMALSRIALEKGYLVYGVVYDSNLVARTIQIKGGSELPRIQKSKYVKSDMAGVYSKIKSQLEGNKKVLFFGLPCEVSALLLFLGGVNENLLTVSLLCGGNVSPFFLEKYREYLEKKTQSKVLDINFRSKKYGTDIYFTEILTPKGWQGVSTKDNFYVTILGSKFVRPSCLDCPFDEKSTKGDIVIGDVCNRDRKDGMNVFAFNDRAKEIVSELNRYGSVEPIADFSDFVARRTTKENPRFDYIKTFYGETERNSLKKAVSKCIVSQWPFSTRLLYAAPYCVRGVYAKWKRKFKK